MEFQASCHSLDRHGVPHIHPGNAEGEMSGGFNSMAAYAVETNPEIVSV